MNTRKTLGTVIIGVAITLAVASIPLIIAGTDQITEKLIVHTSAYTGNVNITHQADYYTRMFYKAYNLSAVNMFYNWHICC